MRSVATVPSRFIGAAPAVLLLGALGCEPAMSSGPPASCPQSPTPQLAATAAPAQTAQGVAASFTGKRPKLVVAIALDQFRADYPDPLRALFRRQRFQAPPARGRQS